MEIKTTQRIIEETMYVCSCCEMAHYYKEDAVTCEMQNSCDHSNISYSHDEYIVVSSCGDCQVRLGIVELDSSAIKTLNRRIHSALEKAYKKCMEIGGR